MTKPTKWVCAKRTLRSAWASAQSDQRPRCPQEESLGPKLPIKRAAKTLIRLGGCPSYPPSLISLRWAHMSFCWFCHDAAHLFQVEVIAPGSFDPWFIQPRSPLHVFIPTVYINKYLQVHVCVFRFWLLFVHNFLAQRNRYLRPGLLQTNVTIFTKSCTNRMSWRVFILYRYSKRIRIMATLCQSSVHQQYNSL